MNSSVHKQKPGDGIAAYSGSLDLSVTETNVNTETSVRFSAAVLGTTSSNLSFSNPNFGSSPIRGENNMAENYREFDKSDTSPIIPEIRIKSYTFRIREILLGAVSVVALVTCLVLVAIVAKNNAAAGSANKAGMTSAQVAVNSLCTDPPCLKSAAYAVSNMNTSVKPCDDFFQYACGNYEKQYPLDPDYGQRTVFWNLYYDNEDKLRTILEQPPVRRSSFSSEKKLKDFFMSCIDDYGKMRAGGKVFIDKIIQPLGGWDVLNTFNASTFDFQSNLEKTSIEFWTAALFTFRVVTDPYERSRRIIEMDMSGMGMSWVYYIRDSAEQIRSDYKKFIRTVGKHLARDSGLDLDQELVDNKTEIFVNDAFDIEHQLANITANTFPTQNAHSQEKRITLSNLTVQTQNVVDFVHFFRTMFGQNNIDGNTRVVLREHDWLGRVMSMVNSLPEAEKARKLQNYFVWRLAQSFVSELSWNYIHASRQFHVDQYGVAAFLGISKHCFKVASKKFSDLMGAIYVRTTFADKNKEKVEEIVQYVKEALIDNIDGNKFLDDETKQMAKAKLTAAKDKMGYPDIYLDNTAIDTIYEHISINRSDYFQNLLNLHKFDQEDWTKRLTTPEDKSRWFFRSYDTAIYFYNPWNELLVPAGLLQFPVYEWTLPHYHNFGAIGGLIGHYFVHAIDQWGSRYNAEGEYGAWYTNKSKAGYDNVKQCYASIYNNKTMGPFKVKGQPQPVMVPVQGARYAWEGLAETSGIRIAYKAYKKWVANKGDEKLTPTPHYTNDQDFFLSYAQLFCYTRSDAMSYYYAQTQRISENIRTNVALSQLKEFTSAFGCPSGSAMNSPKKCDTF